MCCHVAELVFKFGKNVLWWQMAGSDWSLPGTVNKWFGCADQEPLFLFQIIS